MDGTFKVPQSAERRTSAKIIKSSERRKCIKLSAVLFMQGISLNVDLTKWNLISNVRLIILVKII